MITIVGLGAGDINQIPLGVYRRIQATGKIYARTNQHPAITALIAEGILIESFDDIYEKHDQFETVYQEIVATLLGKNEDILYAVPGHPLVAERTVELLLDSGAKIEIVGGQSFLDALFTSVRIDPINGFQLLDGTALQAHEIQTTHHVFIGQVYDAMVTSNVKLTLMERYPDDHPVIVVTQAGMPTELVEKMPLYELDHHRALSNLTTVYIPPTDKHNREFWHLKQIFSILRGPNGCPWDQKQTHESLIKNIQEETQEYVEAVQNGDIDNMVEELGDVLLQIMLNAQIGAEEGYFTIEDVIETLANKMIFRHPHVFGDQKVDSPEEAIQLFKKMKDIEKGEKS